MKKILFIEANEDPSQSDVFKQLGAKIKEYSPRRLLMVHVPNGGLFDEHILEVFTVLSAELEVYTSEKLTNDANPQAVALSIKGKLSETDFLVVVMANVMNQLSVGH